MGNCAIKPKVLKDSEEDLVPVERDSTAPAPEKVATNAVEEAEAAVTAAKRSEKGKDILIEDDVDDHNKRQSLSLLFHENKPIEKEVIDLTPTQPEPDNKTGASSEISKLDDTSTALMDSNVKEPETFDVETRTDLEVKIPKDSEVKTPETPKAKKAEQEEANFSENWEVKFPEELEAKKTSEVVAKVEQEESKLPEVHEVVSPPRELSEIKVPKETNVPEVLEDKNVQEDSKAEAAESELLKVSEVDSSSDLEIKVPKVFEGKTPEVTDESEVKVDQETDVSEFVDAQEKIEKPESPIHEKINVVKEKETVLSKTEEEEEEEKDLLSLEKQLSDLGNK
ncbi:hypothetical protein AALP_AA8G480200 [Arabis alpina]|uniref:Uncharacterized protein n=1 Tax=Arabis alpina TaxID=50452 RepID=A0A087GE57_ARAAL|nr:hypothetical protein AALP_AA8G480200 [Arabis alpina]